MRSPGKRAMTGAFRRSPGRIACAVLALAWAMFLPAANAAPDSGAQPGFSWSHVPLFAHLSKTDDDFTPAEAKFIVQHYALVTIEKAQGLARYGNTEAGTRAAVATLKHLAPGIKVLAYWNAVVDYDNLYAALAQPLPSTWFLAERHSGEGNDRRMFDPENPDFRAWWTNAAMNLATTTGADGLFIDGIPKIANLARRPGAQTAGMRPANPLADARQMLAGLQARLGPNRLLIFNGLRAMPNVWPDGGLQLLGAASGAFVEHFDYLQNSSKELIAQDIDLIRAADRQGKIVLVKAWPDEERAAGNSADAGKSLDFPLACFLVAAGEHSYFGYAWGYRANEGWLQSYPALEHPLGKPTGPASRDGWHYHRSFVHADVSVDLATHTARIVWQ